MPTVIRTQYLKMSEMKRKKSLEEAQLPGRSTEIHLCYIVPIHILHASETSEAM